MSFAMLDGLAKYSAAPLGGTTYVSHSCQRPALGRRYDRWWSGTPATPPQTTGSIHLVGIHFWSLDTNLSLVEMADGYSSVRF